MVRDATPEDAAACAAIYTPYVRDTAITFESTPPSPAEMARRIAAAQRAHAWVVLDEGGRVVGYAYGGPYKDRAAYHKARIAELRGNAEDAKKLYREVLDKNPTTSLREEITNRLAVLDLEHR